ncbi:hypothetical protein [Marinoscillum furvescens]|uniref:AhpC/TSA family protein n=1 Tax=Marinoscillum furvescens DSM 4134 TaxID=1122208 RepID=A0A3D9L2E4_MARFU|nr:hypothetical protein [Marinoscillum furvescens]RED98399.1 hypothetical protein C7460_11071 [Marinoscillum furvescens DSM 4134]
MKIKYLFFGLITCMLIGEITYLVIQIYELNTEVIECGNSYNNCERDRKSNQRAIIYNLFSENVQLPDVRLINSKNESKNLSSIFMEDKLLIYRFYDETCSQCVEDELDIVKQLEDSVGIRNIAIISTFNLNKLISLIKRKEIRCSFYSYSESFPIPIENDRYVASFFVLEKSLYTRFVYKAGGDQIINSPYFKRIINYIKKDETSNFQ